MYNKDIYNFDFSTDYYHQGKIVADIEFHRFIEMLYPWHDSDNQQVCDITFQVTDACNLQCTYCYQINKCNHSMPFEVAKKFIDLLLDNSESTAAYMDTRKTQGAVFDFIGGEPLLEVDLIGQIIEYIENQLIIKDHPWQYCHKYSMTSNGTLYFDPKFQALLQKHHDKISLGITIDGNKTLHDSCRKFPNGEGSYDKAMAAVRHYRENYHASVGTKLTISPYNVKYVYEAVTEMIENGFHAINLNCVYEKGWNNNHATELYYQLKKVGNYLVANDLTDIVYISMFNPDGFCALPADDHENWCGGNGKMIAVDYKGDIFPCLRYMESSLGSDVPPIIIGNVNEGLIPNAACANCVKQLKSVNRLNQSTEECINCEIARGCAWCQAYNYQDSGTFFYRATYICQMHKATALANTYYWNLVYFNRHEKSIFKLWLSDDKALEIIPPEELDLLKALQAPCLREPDNEEENKQWLIKEHN